MGGGHVSGDVHDVGHVCNHRGRKSSIGRRGEEGVRVDQVSVLVDDPGRWLELDSVGQIGCPGILENS